ncbi:MAG: hypothetical protein ACXWK7_06565, partial [Caulobacteraceae bacterium]
MTVSIARSISSAMTNSPLDIIHERRDQIETSLAHLAEQMAALRAEMQELVVAERTITRLIASASGHAPGVGRASAEGAVAEPQAPPSAQAAARSNLKIPDL